MISTTPSKSRSGRQSRTFRRAHRADAPSGKQPCDLLPHRRLLAGRKARLSLGLSIMWPLQTTTLPKVGSGVPICVSFLSSSLITGATASARNPSPSKKPKLAEHGIDFEIGGSRCICGLASAKLGAHKERIRSLVNSMSVFPGSVSQRRCTFSRAS
jgi:hypothetical protein